MKELSTEQKAKAYDKAREKIAVRFGTNVAEEIFSEFEESEDEKIRKSIINLVIVSAQNGGMVLHKWESQQMLAWLEKKGNINPTEDELEALRIAAYEPTKNWSEKLQSLYEKLTHCEQNPVFEMKTPEESLGIDSDTYNKIVDECVYCEQKHTDKSEPTDYNSIDPHFGKPTDKIEPKFRVEKDKWYVCTSQYCNCIEGRNYKASLDGRIIDDYGTEYDMHDDDAYRWFRPWTIQDAKDGDVLVNWNNTIYLFKGIEEEVVKFYCYYNINCEKFSTPLDNKSHLGLTEPQFEHHPATKEQRNLLFQKMREACYEWNAEKKELKKIEQIPAELGENRSKELSLSLQILAYLNTASDELYAKGKPLYSEERIKDIHKCMLMWQKLHNAYFYQKPTWSEEDERIIKRIKSLLYSINENDFKDIYAWLEFLKDRIQPKQEWSEEDEVKINRIVACLENLNVADNDILLKDVDWLKSLIPQNRWKPSEEQLNALDEVYKTHGANNVCRRVIFNLLEQLKKL